MSVRLRGSVSSSLLAVDTSQALRASLSPPSVVAADGGGYETTLQTGLVTLLSAHTAAAGHFGVFRWGSTTKSALIDYIRITGAMVTDFTTLQRFQVSARITRGYTASHAGGTALTKTGDNFKLRKAYATTAVTDIRVSTTADLTDGTHTVETQPFQTCIISNANDGATAKRPVSESVCDRLARRPIVLVQDEGIIFSNDILMGAVGTAQLSVTIGWREMLNASVPAGI